ncbi:MAG TPA: hypothetical protein VM146_09470 [Steroidobacteraceae bacterium]|nr:hypothetical protein [Steroidobacteraceae bacterium]
MKKTLIVIAAATLIPLGAAVAGEGKDKAGSMSPSFDTLDANRDGRISQAEAATDTTIVFSSADSDGDGYLDKKEFRAHQKGGSSGPQQQSMPQSSTPEATAPESTSPDSSATDQTVPEPAASEPKPDTETPRQ